MFSFGEILVNTKRRSTFLKLYLCIDGLPLYIASESYKLPRRFTDLKPCASLFAVTTTVLEYYIEALIAVA